MNNSNLFLQGTGGGREEGKTATSTTKKTRPPNCKQRWSSALWKNGTGTGAGKGGGCVGGGRGGGSEGGGRVGWWGGGVVEALVVFSFFWFH